MNTRQPELALLPDYNLTYVANDALGKPIKNRKYIVTLPSGEEIVGKTDNQGKTRKIITKGPQQVSITLEDLSEENNGYQILREKTNE